MRERVAAAELEALLWTVVEPFEALALEQYQRHLPELAALGKAALLARLPPPDAGAAARACYGLSAPVERVLASLRALDGERAVLVAQAYLLETFRATLYDLLAQNPALTQAGRALAALGQAQSRAVLDRVPGLLERRVGGGQALLAALVETTGEALVALDVLGGELERIFAPALALSTSAVMANFLAALVAIAAPLGVDRRRLVLYVTSLMMEGA
jgi:hypothetical protein